MIISIIIMIMLALQTGVNISYHANNCTFVQ